MVLTWAFRAGECDACGQGAQPYKAGQAREYESVLLTKAAAEFWDPTGLPSPLPSHGWYQQALFGGARPRPDHAPGLLVRDSMIGRVRTLAVFGTRTVSLASGEPPSTRP